MSSGRIETTTRPGWGALLLASVCVVSSAQAGTPEPSFTATTLHDGELTLDGLRGKVVLLEFWASWCGSCIEGLPALKALYEQHVDDGLEIVGISLDEDPKALRRAVAEHRLEWPQICDGLGKASPLAQRFDVRGTPRYVLIDRGGHVAAEYVKPSELESAVRDLLTDD